MDLRAAVHPAAVKALMTDLNPDERTIALARTMGGYLRAGRRRRYPRDTQEDFARRVGVSRYTYVKMEQGDPSVSLRSYLTAAVLLGIGEQFRDGLQPPPRPFFED